MEKLLKYSFLVSFDSCSLDENLNSCLKGTRSALNVCLIFSFLNFQVVKCALICMTVHAPKQTGGKRVMQQLTNAR